jgi:hypothetical protein
MKSPFPGMDPYLEAPDLWRGLHLRLINHIAEYLQPQLLPRYVAMVEERIMLGAIDGERVPDLGIVQSTVPSRSGGTAVLVPTDCVQPEVVEVPELRQPHRFVEVRRARDGELVTVIEVLSPGNKSGTGLAQYEAKQQQYLLSDINLVEIDLLHRGRHAIAVPADRITPSDYRVSVLPAGSTRFELYRISLREPLPRFRVPLQSDDPEVALDLQAVLDRCYEAGAYSYVIRYDQPPGVPLSAEDAAWARERVEAWQRERATSDR